MAVAPLLVKPRTMNANVNNQEPLHVMLEVNNQDWARRREIYLHLSFRKHGSTEVEAVEALLPMIEIGHSVITGAIGHMQRGRYELLPDCAIFSGFPFGFIHQYKRIESQAFNLVVRPFTFPIDGMAFDLGSAHSYTSVGSAPTIGDNIDFFGVREYRYGDSIRHIDWKSSAKSGEWIVREFEQVVSRSLIIALNTSVVFAKPTPATFEKSVSIAASVVAHCLSRHCQVGVYSRYRWISPDLGQEHADEIEAFLIDVTLSSQSHYLEDLIQHLQTLPTGQAVLVFENALTCRYEDIQAAVSMLVAMGHEVKVVMFTPDGHFPALDACDAFSVHLDEEPDGKIFEHH